MEGESERSRVRESYIVRRRCSDREFAKTSFHVATIRSFTASHEASREMMTSEFIGFVVAQ